MKKFLNDLKKELSKLKISNEEIDEILADHQEMIEEALKQGLSEDELTIKFGDPSKVAKELYEDQQKVVVNMEEYTQNTQYETIKGYKLLKSLPVIDFNEIQIKLISEDIEIYPYDGENIEVHYTNEIQEKNYEVLLVNGIFKLSRTTSRIGIFEKKKTPDFVVRYPNTGQLGNYTIETVSGDCEMKGINSKTLKLKSTSGDFEGQGIKGETAEFSTVSGNFELSNVSVGEVNISSVSGDFEGKRIIIARNLTINTVSGDFELSNLTAKEASFNTVSGDLEGKEFYVEKIDLKSVSGEVTQIKVEQSQ